MSSNLNEPFIVYKNYRQQQKDAKNESLKEKIVPKEIKKKIEKPKKSTNQQQTTQKQTIDQNLLIRFLHQQKQQQYLLQQIILDQRMQANTVDEIDEFSPIYIYGIPTTPQNVGLQRRMSRDDDDFKI